MWFYRCNPCYFQARALLESVWTTLFAIHVWGTDHCSPGTKLWRIKRCSKKMQLGLFPNYSMNYRMLASVVIDLSKALTLSSAEYWEYVVKNIPSFHAHAADYFAANLYWMHQFPCNNKFVSHLLFQWHDGSLVDIRNVIDSIVALSITGSFVCLPNTNEQEYFYL